MLRIMGFNLVLLLFFQINAQTMVLHKSDGSSVGIPIADINKITFQMGTTNVQRIEAAKKIKTVFAKIFPNPLTTKIEYQVSEPSEVFISVKNIQGKAVSIIQNQKMDKGIYSVSWNECDSEGIKVTNGAYIISIVIAGKSISKTLFIVK